MQKNDKFVENFFWLISTMSFELFTKIEIFLKMENKFIATKAKIFKNEVCNLVSLGERTEVVVVVQKIHSLLCCNMYTLNIIVGVGRK